MVIVEGYMSISLGLYSQVLYSYVNRVGFQGKLILRESCAEATKFSQ